MLLKRKLLILTSVILIVFFTILNVLFRGLSANEKSEVRKLSVHQKILSKIQDLPQIFIENHSEFVPEFVKNINSQNFAEFGEVWKEANSWLSETRVVNFLSPRLGELIFALKHARITKADLDTRGTQLKLFLTLEGNQSVVFKPQRYDKNRVIEGPVYSGKDRYGAEIVAFYLSAILDLPFTPVSTLRTVSLSREVLPVATKRLHDTSFKISDRVCVYGKCFYCKIQDPVCEDHMGALTGALIFNINAELKNHRSPWQRTYKGKKAVWEISPNYCQTVKEKFPRKRLLDLVDTAVFDFLIQNGDRHHYQTMYDFVVLLDNGKGFGNPNIQHLDILAPLYQCCLVRNVTVKKLENLAGGRLRRSLEAMPEIHDLISTAHLDALEERLLIILATVEYCKNK